MRKLLFLLTLSLFVIGANAQKGSWYIGTTTMGITAPEATATGITATTVQMGTGFNYFKVNDAVKVTNFGVAPEVGYFISDKFALGFSGLLPG